MVMGKPAQAAWGILVLGLAALGGCGKPILSVSDTVQIGDNRTLLMGYAERSDLRGRWSAAPGVRITYLVDGKVVGSAVSDAHGFAGLRVPVPTDARGFVAQAEMGGQKLDAQGVIFHWSADRTIVVFDIDGTISWTDYPRLYVGKSNEGTVPIEHASQTLKQLSSRYNIVYLSARPRELLALTKQWLKEYDFPAGPLIAASSVDQGLHAEMFKTRTLREAREHAPQVLIGVGNLESDAEAYGANHMLALIRHKTDDKEFRAHAIIFPDWTGIAQFFEANAGVLENPAALAKAIAEGRMLLQPQFPYSPRP